jgi:glycolate oxidase iron-sulfur subunit
MQSKSTSGPFDDPTLAEARDIIKTCNHFGFCTATCPTYVLSHDENESPRGRIDLIHAMLATPGPPDAATVRHLDTCLSCLACVSTCAVKVDYMHLIDTARAHIEQGFGRPWPQRLFRTMIANTVPHRSRFRLALALGRAVAPLARFMPARFTGALKLIPKPAVGGTADVRPGTYAAEGVMRQRVALLAGCAQRVLAPQINAATVRLLTRQGCEVVVVRGAECCGALTLHMGRVADARRAARRNIDAWIAQSRLRKLDAVIVNASGCGTTVKDYGHLFKHDPEYRESARTIAAMTMDVSEFLERIGLRAESVTARHYAVAYHDACSLRNGQRIVREPRQLLRTAGFRVLDVPEAHFCCGSAGAYNLLQPEIARRLGERKARHVDSTGASMLAVGNVGCLAQLGCYTTLPIVHTVELLDWATGGPMPAKLKGRMLPEQESVPGTPRTPSGLGLW